MKRYLILIILGLMLMTTSFGLNITEDYTVKALNERIEYLGSTYDEITVENLGLSYLDQEIKCICLKNSETTFDESMRYNKGIYHFLVLGGVHARERLNPKLLIKQIEYYVEKDLIPKNMVIHYIPLVNPDGYNISLFNGIDTEVLQGINDKNYPRWKSNLRGVDINRNFPDIYLDLDTFTWKNSWGRSDNKAFRSYGPSGEFYFGKYAGSEIETQIIMAYMNRYKFEMALDYHSQGEVLYVGKWFMSEAFNEKSLSLANTIMDINGYTQPRKTGEYSSGFTMNYMANIHRVPSITIETTRTRNLPYLTNQEEIKAYEENENVTLEVFKKAIEMTVFGFYKTYDSDGYFFDDYQSEAVAKAYAQKYNLSIKEYEEAPLEHLDDFMSEWAFQSIEELVSRDILNIDLSKGYQNNISVEAFLENLKRINEERYKAYEQPEIVELISSNQKINRIQASYILYTYLEGELKDRDKVAYEDIDLLIEEYKNAVYYVNNMGLIKGYSNIEFEPGHSLTKEEAAVILLRVFRLNHKGAL